MVEFSFLKKQIMVSNMFCPMDTMACPECQSSTASSQPLQNCVSIMARVCVGVCASAALLNPAPPPPKPWICPSYAQWSPAALCNFHSHRYPEGRAAPNFVQCYGNTCETMSNPSGASPTRKM